MLIWEDIDDESIIIKLEYIHLHFENALPFFRGKKNHLNEKRYIVVGIKFFYCSKSFRKIIHAHVCF